MPKNMKNLVQEIKNRMIDLNNETRKMSKNENEKANEKIDVVAEFLDFNEQYQQGRGLKILTPEQMLSRLPISFAQLKAGSTSEKLRNEIRQLLYSLHRSKKLSKTIYKHLMNGNNIYQHFKQ